MNVLDLEPRRHAPPAGWDARAFESLTDAIAAALVEAFRQREAAGREP